MAVFHSYLWPSNIPVCLCVCVCVCLCTPSLSGHDVHLGCFCVLAIVNNAGPGLRIRSVGFNPSSIYFNDVKVAFGIRSQPCGHAAYIVI